MAEENNVEREKPKKSKVGIYLLLTILGVSIFGGAYFLYDEQKSITGQAISNLESQLKSQERILEEQEQLSEEGIASAEQKIARAEAERRKLIDEIEELSETTCRDVQVPYEDKEAYTEQEPYLRTEGYYESEPYIVEECEDVALAYNKVAGSCTQYKDHLFTNDEPATYSYTINNLDSEKGGIFIVGIGFRIGGQLVIEEQSKYIEPSSSHTFYTEKLAKIENCSFSIVSKPTKEICETLTKYQDVLKTREVTDYKTVTKYRTITKYRTETVCD